MQDDHRYLQILGTVFLFVFSVLLLLVRYVQSLSGGWRDAILLAALYNLMATVVRVVSMLGLLSQLEGRVVNGLVASVFVCALIVSIISNYQERRAKGKMPVLPDSV